MTGYVKMLFVLAILTAATVHAGDTDISFFDGVLYCGTIPISLMHQDEHWRLVHEKQTKGACSYSLSSNAGEMSVRGTFGAAPHTMFNVTKTLVSRGNGGVTYSCALDASTPVRTKRLALSVDLPSDEFAGRTIYLDNDTIALPRIVGDANLAMNKSCHTVRIPTADGDIIVTGDLTVIVSDGRKWKLPFSIGLLMLPCEGAITRSELRIDISFRKTNNREQTSSWYPCTGSMHAIIPGSALDMSSWIEKPAGVHGHVRACGDEFSFSDGTIARFWGINLSLRHQPFPDKERSDRLAKRLSQMGANMVRVYLDANDGYSVFGNALATTRTFKADAVDRFHYLLSALKREGIYLDIVLMMGRRVCPADGVGQLPDKSSFHVRGEFLPELITLQKEFASTLFSQRNQYTQMTLAEDPAVACVEIINEDSLFFMGNADGWKLTEAYELSVWQRQFNQWLRDQAFDRATLVTRWLTAGGAPDIADNEDPATSTVRIPSGGFRGNWCGEARKNDTYRFLCDKQRAFYHTMVEYLHVRCGVRSLICGSSHWVSDYADLALNADLDFVNRHHYWAHAEGGYGLIGVTYDTRSMLKSDDGGLVGSIFAQRVLGKPYLVSEWDFGLPNEYQAEGQLLMSAYASLHGISMLQWESGDFSEQPKALNYIFDVSGNPVQMALWPLSALLFHRRDVRTADSFFRLSVAEHTCDPSRSPNVALLRTAACTAKAGVSFKESTEGTEIVSAAAGMDGLYRSITGEIIWDTRTGKFVIDTERTQSVCGFFESSAVASRDAIFSIKNRYAAVAITSLSMQPIASSKRLLLVAAARMRNTGMRYSPDGSSVVDKGTLPILIEQVTGQVELKGRTITSVQRLTLSGERVEDAKVRFDGGRILLREDDATMHYEIQVK